MKKIFSSAVALFILLGAANAQTSNSEKTDSKKESRKKGLKEAGLSADQKAKIESIKKSYRKQLSHLKTKNSFRSLVIFFFSCRISSFNAAPLFFFTANFSKPDFFFIVPD